MTAPIARGLVAAGTVAYAESVADIKAIPVAALTKGQRVWLSHDTRHGIFYWKPGDQSAKCVVGNGTTTGVNSSSDTCTLTAHGLATGDPIIALSAVNGLSLNTAYYAIVVDANSFKLATSFANANSGVAVDLTGTTNFSYKRLLDTTDGLYIIRTGDALDGSTGAFFRALNGSPRPEMCGAVGDGATDDLGAFAPLNRFARGIACAAAAVYLLGASYAFSAGLAFEDNARIKPASGKQVSIESLAAPPDRWCLDLTASGSFVFPKKPALYLRWLGAKGDSVFAAGSNPIYDEWGAFTSGTDDTAAVQACFDATTTVLVGNGKYRTTRANQKFDFQQIIGVGRDVSMLYVSSGYGICNYTATDATAAFLSDWRQGFGMRDMRLRGPYFTPDDWTAGATLTVSGRSKTLATPSSANIGLRLKAAYPVTLKNVRIEHFHYGVYSAAGAEHVYDDVLFWDCQVGDYSVTGSEWGDGGWKYTTAAYKGTTRFRQCWIGLYSNAMVQATFEKSVVFEPCLTAFWGQHTNDTEISGYFELCNEGIVLDGGFLGTNIVKFPFFNSGGGGGWGTGNALHILPSASAYSRTVYIQEPGLEGAGGVVCEAGVLTRSYGYGAFSFAVYAGSTGADANLDMRMDFVGRLLYLTHNHNYTFTVLPDGSTPSGLAPIRYQIGDRIKLANFSGTGTLKALRGSGVHFFRGGTTIDADIFVGSRTGETGKLGILDLVYMGSDTWMVDEDRVDAANQIYGILPLANGGTGTIYGRVDTSVFSSNLGTMGRSFDGTRQLTTTTSLTGTLDTVANAGWTTSSYILLMNFSSGNLTINKPTGGDIYINGGTHGNLTIGTIGWALLQYTGSNVWFAMGQGLSAA